ncbi:Histone H1.5 [Larimichthys crocea]|uniref:Histone H1.5 n=1 Tax=Larimichthys crocea TaxID=215358 RepID=A0A6G0IKJ6_LARCR|nr:Histone H1.5 [Larimichthys crocea]
MSSPAAALPVAAPAKSPIKRARPQKKKNAGPTLRDQIMQILFGSNQRGGVSLPALKKSLKAGGYDVDKKKAILLLTLKRLVAKNTVVQTKGSYKANKKPPTPRKKVVKKKPKAKKVKKVKKAAGAATPKKSPKKKRKPKSPKKAKTPAAAKKPKATKKAKSPKKAKRSTRTRAAAKK